MRLLTPGILLAAVGVAFAASSIDGVWSGFMDVDLNQHSANRKSAAPNAVAVTFEFNVKGNNLTGSMSVAKGNKPDIWVIRKGRVVGSSLSFEAFREAKNEEMWWSGTFVGNQIKLTRGKKGLGRQVVLKRE